MWELLLSRLSAAFASVAGFPADPVLQRSSHADFQANGALALAKRLGMVPREIAAQVIAHAQLDGIAAAEVSGPGFINLTVAPELLAGILTRMAADERLGVARVASPQRVIVDYAGPNVAKQMHVGHLRSAVIGDCLLRVLRFTGHEAQSVSHIGDWGTPFGMLLERLVESGAAGTDRGGLDALYKSARSRFDSDPDFADRARARVVALHSGDPRTLRLWREVVAESQRHFLEVNRRLGLLLRPEDHVGESFYQEQLAEVVDELCGKGLLTESEGALCAFQPGFDAPLIVRKRDGGYSYATTDLAAVRHRARQFDRLIYVIGTPQSRHLAMVFAVAQQAGWLNADGAQHVAFGSVLGTDGRMLRSRAGESVKLLTLLDEAMKRAHELSTDPEVAVAVSVGALKYADLSANRRKDYVFDLDRMVGFTGDTAGYLQFAYARALSILRKSDEPPGDLALGEPAEHALALELACFPRAVAETAETLEPHRLAGYLRALAVAFTGFVESCPVLRAPQGVRGNRLALCDLTAKVLACGLNLLGITAPPRM